MAPGGIEKKYQAFDSRQRRETAWARTSSGYHSDLATNQVGRQLRQALETKVVEIVGAQFVAQEGGELLVLINTDQERVLEIGAKDMVTMLDLIDDGGKLAGQPAMEALTEDRGDLVGC
jgi:hypothetical protein